MVPVELRRLLFDTRRDEHAMYLCEVAGSRGFPVEIGIFEATILDRLLKERKSQRPMTHDLLLGAIEALGGKVARAEIDGVDQDFFYAKLVLARGEEEVRVDARPSDAVTLALMRDVPILVRPEVFDQAATTG